MSHIFSPLITEDWSGNNYGHFEPYQKKKFIVLHGPVSNNKEVVKSTWQPVGTREASANYVCGVDFLAGVVGEQYGSWHSGGSGLITNHNSISIEIMNDFVGTPPYYNDATFDKRAVERAIKLVVDICKRQGIAPSRNTIVGHKETNATSCPQTLDVDNFVKRVQEIYYNIKKTLEKGVKKTMFLIKLTENHDKEGKFNKGDIFLFDTSKKMFAKLDGKTYKKYDELKKLGLIEEQESNKVYPVFTVLNSLELYKQVHYSQL